MSALGPPGRLPETLPEVLQSLQSSLEDTNEMLEKVMTIEPAKKGLSLLDTKNELLRSYLQHVAFLIITKIRSLKLGQTPPQLSDDAVQKLVELRLYIEKGVRPLEGKLKFSMYSTLKAADDAERKAAGSKSGGMSKDDESDSDADSESESEADGEDGNHGRKDVPIGGHDDDKDGASDDSDSDAPRPLRLDRFKALVPSRGDEATSTASKNKQSEDDAVYRAPKTKRVLMPAGPSELEDRRRRREPGLGKSSTLEDYLETELSAAPKAEPSVGTTFGRRGRDVRTDADRRAAAERAEYEERNFVRLPKESKKDRVKTTRREGAAGGGGRMQFGGEDFRDLGHSADRIGSLTKRKDGPTGTKALLERSRKRDLHGATGGGVEMGGKFRKKLKRL